MPAHPDSASFPLTASSALPDTLRELLRTQAPTAVLLAGIDNQVLRLSVDSPTTSASDLTPPDAWFDSGELSWLTRDGALLGLLWSMSPVPAAAVQMLTLLLSAGRSDMAQREADVLMTQLPEGVAWLSDDLVFQQISRRFLELHQLSAGQVIGLPFAAVFPKRRATGELLIKAAAGHSVSQEREWLPSESAASPPSGGRWLRSQMRPYYGGAAAGVLWTMQDISQEVSLSARVQALLLGARLPTAVLSAGGEVLERSLSLRRALPDISDPHHALLWDWPIWIQPAKAEQQLKDALARALSQPQQRFECRLQVVGGESVSVSVCWSEDASDPLPQTVDALPVAEFRFDNQLSSASPHSSLLSGVIAHSPQATLLLGAADDSGERPLWLASEAAAKLLGVHASLLSVPGGAPLGSLLRALGIQLARPDLTPLSAVTLTTQASAASSDDGQTSALDAVLTRPDGSRRHLQISAARLSAEGAARRDEPLALYLHDVTTVRSLEHRLKHDALHDPLTGLPNWTGLRARVAALAGSASDKAAYSVIAFCLDDFGVLQAALGRQSGDHLLIQVAARLHHWREGVQVARLEGEQFALVAPALSSSEAMALAREVQLVLTPTMRVGGREVLVSASVGVAYGPMTAERADTLLEQARTALLSARRTGRAGRQMYTPELSGREAGQLALEHDLHLAVPSQLTLLFQPMVNFATGRVQGAEVLLRWQHPTRGLLSPAQFLPLAERAGLLPTLGRWVVAEAVAQRQRWQTAYPKVRLSLNLSAAELLDQEVLSELGQHLSEVGGLDLELGAGSLLGQAAAEETSAALTRLREAGAHLWVDDFGDGASSLTALERFPLSGVKLHPSFVANLLGGPRPLALLEGTVALARKLNLEVIAVGVETQAQAALLEQAGCQAAQGFLYSPPLTEAEFERWLGTQVLD